MSDGANTEAIHNFSFRFWVQAKPNRNKLVTVAWCRFSAQRVKLIVQAVQAMSKIAHDDAAASLDIVAIKRVIQ